MLPKLFLPAAKKMFAGSDMKQASGPVALRFAPTKNANSSAFAIAH
jgi:hypothetical protein